MLPSTVEITRGSEVVSSVLIGEGLTTGPDLAALLVPGGLTPHRTAVFAQPGSHRLAEAIAGRLDGSLRLLPDREAAKTLGVVEQSYLWLNELGFTRGDLIVAVGGGALTDAVGFIAATYLRGVPIVLVPTTLLGAVDAAIGGKTGINVGGKNLAGAFRHPERVVVDVGVLSELPPGLLREGAAEAVKAGLVGDGTLVELLERHGLEAPMGEVVERAIRVKARIVSEDFTERGVRAFLNYGHTVGHGIEFAAGISHGEAVAIGMVAAGTVSARKLGFPAAARQRRLLEHLGLPTVAPEVLAADVRRLMELDKKRDAGGLRMTLLRRIGEPEVLPVDDADVTAALEAVAIH